MSNYHAFSFQYPSTHPYDQSDYRWTSFLGEFVLRVGSNSPNLLYWASDYGSTVEFKVLTDDLTSVSKEIDKLKACGFVVNDLNRTLEDDLGSNRFIGPDSTSNKTQRAMVVLKSLKAVCDLMLDSIIKRPDGYWTQETCGDKKQNPIGNHMFSVMHLHHLIANADALICPFVTADSKFHLLSYYYYENNKMNLGPHSPLPSHAVRL